MTPELLAANVLPYVVWFAIVIGFLAAVTVGLAFGLALIFLQSMMSSQKKFNANMDETHAAFAKLHAATEAKLLSQVRMSEAWHRTRQEDLKEEDAEARGNSQSYPKFTQDWRAKQNT